MTPSEGLRMTWGLIVVTLSEAKGLSPLRSSLAEILRFAQNDRTSWAQCEVFLVRLYTSFLILHLLAAEEDLIRRHGQTVAADARSVVDGVGHRRYDPSSCPLSRLLGAEGPVGVPGDYIDVPHRVQLRHIHHRRELVVPEGGVHHLAVDADEVFVEGLA